MRLCFRYGCPKRPRLTPCPCVCIPCCGVCSDSVDLLDCPGDLLNRPLRLKFGRSFVTGSAPDQVMSSTPNGHNPPPPLQPGVQLLPNWQELAVEALSKECKRSDYLSSGRNLTSHVL